MAKRPPSANLNKKYDDGFHAVKDVNLEIRDKEFVVLVGPSGCGKTTTLAHGRRAGGDHLGRDPHRRPGGERPAADGPRHRHGVPELRALPAHERVRQHGVRPADAQVRPKDEIEKRVREAAEILGIQPLLERKPRQLSGGQRQRVALGRAIVRHPQVFLFDEPLSNLDAKLRVQMRVELKRLHERLETTAIYVTHDQVEAMTLGDRVVVMKDGLVQQVGEPLELYGRPANRFVAGFIGSPAMNFVEVRDHRAQAARCGRRPRACASRCRRSRRARARAQPASGLTLGVRPEALHLANGADAADYSFATAVDVVEPLGNEILLNFRAGGVPMVARVDPERARQGAREHPLRARSRAPAFFRRTDRGCDIADTRVL